MRKRIVSHRLPVPALVLALLVALVALPGCAAASPTPSPSPAPTSTPTPAPDPAVVYFLVSESGAEEHGDSFVLPLTKPEDIAAARALIERRRTEPGTSKIVLARIEKGSGDGVHVNRNLADGKAWSWHVSEFLGFPDMSVEIYDGWPGYVEENLDEWIRITEGRIGFWSYTVTKELAPSDVAP